MNEGILRHSWVGSFADCAAFAHGAALLAAPSIPLIAVGLWWHSNTISHSFIHLPFFRTPPWMSLYSLYLTVGLGKIRVSLFKSVIPMLPPGVQPGLAVEGTRAVTIGPQRHRVYRYTVLKSREVGISYSGAAVGAK
jgi:hypothetical protein